jgi:small nuclear ribonucleoprotein (snRNP)-like protein
MSLFTRYPVLRQVIVNTQTDKAFSGVLWARRGGYLVLRNARLLQAGGSSTAIDGEVVIDASNIDFVQVVN